MYLVLSGSHYAAPTCGNPPAFSLPSTGIIGVSHRDAGTAQHNPEGGTGGACGARDQTMVPLLASAGALVL